MPKNKKDKGLKKKTKDILKPKNKAFSVYN